MQQTDGPSALRTRRLLLRRPVADDAQEVLRLHRDPLAIAHNPSDRLTDEAEARDLLGRWIRHWEDRGIGYWVVSQREQPNVLGFCGVKAMTLHGRPVANLLYRLDPDYWGRGVASEAASAAVTRALRHWPDRPVIARIRPDNQASARVAIKSGLIRAPELDTHGEDGTDHIYTTTKPTIP